MAQRVAECNPNKGEPEEKISRADCDYDRDDCLSDPELLSRASPAQLEVGTTHRTRQQRREGKISCPSSAMSLEDLELLKHPSSSPLQEGLSSAGQALY